MYTFVLNNMRRHLSAAQKRLDGEISGERSLSNNRKWMLSAAFALACFSLEPVAVQADETALITAVDATYPPHSMPSLSGGVEGFNVDLAQEIGKRLKRKVEVQSMQYSGIIPALLSGRLDFIAAPVTVTPERAANVLLTEGYLNADFQFVTRKGVPKEQSLDDFKGKIIAVNKGAAHDQWARQQAAAFGWTVTSYGTIADAVQAVVAGRADTTVTGSTAAAWIAQKNAQLQLSYLHATGVVWAAATRKDDPALRSTIENAIECMKLDGTLAAMHEKWFKTNAAAESAALTVFPGTGTPGFEGYEADQHKPACQ